MSQYEGTFEKNNEVHFKNHKTYVAYVVAAVPCIKDIIERCNANIETFRMKNIETPLIKKLKL